MRRPLLKFRTVKIGHPLYLLLLIMAISSCTKREELVFPDGSGQLVGTWEWVSSSGGWSGGVITPASTGRDHRIEYFRDGRFMRKTGDHFTSGTYSLEPGDRPYAQFHITHTALLQEHASWLYSSGAFEGPDTLHLDDNMRDGYNHTYVRVR
jgi:hypothetical protein